MLLVFLATTAVSQNMSAPPPKKRDPIVCVDESDTGSRMAKRRVCKKRSEWAKQADANSDQFGRDRGGSMPPR